MIHVTLMRSAKTLMVAMNAIVNKIIKVMVILVLMLVNAVVIILVIEIPNAKILLDQTYVNTGYEV